MAEGALHRPATLPDSWTTPQGDAPELAADSLKATGANALWLSGDKQRTDAGAATFAFVTVTLLLTSSGNTRFSIPAEAE